MGLQLALGKELLSTTLMCAGIFFSIGVMLPHMILVGALVCKIFLTVLTVKVCLPQMLFEDVVPQVSSVGILLLTQLAVKNLWRTGPSRCFSTLVSLKLAHTSGMPALEQSLTRS